MKAELYLASQSPRRRALLEQIGVTYRVLVPETDERPLPSEVPADYVCRVAANKAQAGITLAAERGLPPLPVLAADTTVVLGRRILGKPADAAAAHAMLAALSGRSHRVLSAIALAWDERLEVRLSQSRVRFRPLLPEEIAAYVASGEPHDKAGAYAIQGRAALFVQELKGSYSGVMGLPLFETGALLAECGLDLFTGAP